MFFFRKPNLTEIERFLTANRDSGFSYEFVGASRGVPPAGWATDQNRMKIGNGRSDFENAKRAIRNWRMFDMSWVRLCWPESPIENGRVVAILICHFGFYSLNAARIVYVIDEPDRFGFAYGTLQDHAESGEERFLVEFTPETGDVVYDLFAFSRPGHFLSHLGYPLARSLQKKFAAGSMAAMVQAVGSGSSLGRTDLQPEPAARPMTEADHDP